MENQDLVLRKINGGYDFDNFDESQHVNGCPLKWFYNKKLSEQNKFYRIERRYSNQSLRKGDNKKDKNKMTRDRTPSDVKIRKINLVEKEIRNKTEKPRSIIKPDIPGKLEASDESSETHRRKLAAKLNWKLHDQSRDESETETISELSFRRDYLPPRPLNGLKPLLSILLLPNQASICCTKKIHLHSESQPKEERSESPTLSIKLLEMPSLPLEKNLRPKTVQSQRWGSKSHRLQKKLQIPNQVTINLRYLKPQNNLKLNLYSSTTRKHSGDKKSDSSLSNLFYELHDKTNQRNRSKEGFEELIRDITMKEDEFKIKRFFQSNVSSVNIPEFETKSRSTEEKTSKLTDDELIEPANQLNLTCEKVPIFRKFPEKRKQKTKTKKCF